MFARDLDANPSTHPGVEFRFRSLLFISGSGPVAVSVMPADGTFDFVLGTDHLCLEGDEAMLYPQLNKACTQPITKM